MACNIEAVKALIKQIENKPTVQETVKNLKKALKDMELLKAMTLDTSKPSVVEQEIREQMLGIGRELQELYNNQRYLDAEADLKIIDKQIKAKARELEKLQEKLGLKGSIGDRLLSLAPPRKNKGSEAVARLSDYFTAKPVGNNLDLVEDLFGDNFELVQENVAIAEHEKTYFDSAKEHTVNMMNAIEDFVANDMDQKEIKDWDVEEGYKANNRFQSISRLLLTGAPKSQTEFEKSAKGQAMGKTSIDGYTLPKEIVTAIALAANDWLINEAVMRADRRTDDDLKRLLNKSPGEAITKEERERVAKIDGFMTNAAVSIGGIVYKNLGLKVKAKEGENRELLEGKLKTELGLLAIAAMEKDKRIITAKLDGEAVFGEGKDSTGGKGVYVFRYTTAEDMAKRNSTKPSGSQLVDEKQRLFAPASRFANKIVGTETARRTPTFEAPVGPRKVKTAAESGKYFDVAQESQDAVNKQEAQSWEFDNDFVDSYMEMVKTEKGREDLREVLGWIEPNSVHLELRPGVNGKNAQIESNMQYLEELSEQMKVERTTKMWFPWKFVKNGRFILDTNTFNPQGKKLHRFAIFSKEAVVTEENQKFHKLALAMAFGADIDKRSEATSLKTWADIDAQLTAFLDEEMSDLDILKELKKNGLTVFDHKDGKDTVKEGLKPHDMEHAMGGIAEYRRLYEHRKTNKTDIGAVSRLPIETDAITSGYILKTMQLPLIGFEDETDTEQILGALAKGGIQSDGSKFRNYGEQSESGEVEDAYNTPATVMREKHIGKVQEELLANNAKDPRYKAANKSATELALGLDMDESLETITRSFMKSPFMTFNYGAGLSSIVSALGEDAIESFYKMVADPKKRDQVYSILETSVVGSFYDNKEKKWVVSASKKNTAEVTAFYEKFTDPSTTDVERMEMKLPEAVVKNIKSNIAAGVGVALERTFNETYGVYIEAGQTINDTFTMMFRLFKAKVDVAIKAKQEELGADGKRRHLTTEETDAVILEMTDSLPAIKAALAGANDNAKLMIYKTESTFYDSLDGGIEDNGQGRVKLANGKEKYSAQSKTYQLIEAASSGAVVPIHYIDGSIQTIVANSGVSGLGVHDAWMLNIDEAMSGTQAYNKGTARVSTEYSMITELVNGVNESLNNATAEEIHAVNMDYAKDELAKDPAAPVPNVVNETHTRVDNLRIHAEKARTLLFNQPLYFEHAALEGSGYDMDIEYESPKLRIELEAGKGNVGMETPKELEAKQKVEKADEAKKAALQDMVAKAKVKKVPKKEPEVVKETTKPKEKPDYSNLAPKERKFMEDFDSGLMARSEAKLKRYAKLKEKAKKPKPETRAEFLKKYSKANIPAGMDEDAWLAEGKAAWANKGKIDTVVQGMTDEDIAEVDRAYNSPLDKENSAIITELVKSAKAEELDFDIEAEISAAYMYAENSFKKCKK